jgi:hypothetical protein
MERAHKLIAFVSNSAWSVYNFRLDVIRYLMQQGFEVMVMAPDDDYSSYLQESGCRFIPLNFNNKTENPVSDLFFYRQLKTLYRQHRPDFIFHYVAKPNIYGSLAAAAIGIPSVAVITGLGYPFAKRNWLYHIVKHLYKRALRKTREVWFLNNEDAKIFINEHIVNIEKVKVLPGEGIDTDYFSFTINPNYLDLNKNNVTATIDSKGGIGYNDAPRNSQGSGFVWKKAPSFISAEGKSIIENIDQIDRGYQNIDTRLNMLGADIRRMA